MPDIVASGYKDLLSTPLADGVIYAGTIVDANKENDFLYHVTNSTVLSELTQCGQVVQFVKPPQVGDWRDYELNQPLVSDQPSSDSFCISICDMAYKSIKIDEMSIYRACNHWDEFETGFLTDVWNNLSALWHTRCLTGMQLQVSSRNLGKNAGRHRNIDLGTVGNPVHLDPTNIVSFFSRNRAVLQDSGRWYDGQMFMLVPRDMEILLLETFFAKQLCCNTGESVLFKGLKAKDILGFTVIETDRLTPVVDPATKRLVYPIISGWREAYAFTGDIVKARLKEMDRAFGITYDMLSVFGGGVIYPEALAKSYVTFSTSGTVGP